MAPNAEPEKDFPWWLVILAVTGLWLLYKLLADPFYAGALTVLSKGLVVTLAVAGHEAIDTIFALDGDFTGGPVTVIPGPS